MGNDVAELFNRTLIKMIGTLDNHEDFIEDRLLERPCDLSDGMSRSGS